MEERDSSSEAEIGPLALVTLATGGMVGGGIYVALGVVVEVAGQWAWLSFVIAGAVAVATAYSYAALTHEFQASGGAFAFLEGIDRRGAAGSLSWVLLLAYTLTIALYAFAFGRYVGHAFGLDDPLPKVLAVAILAVLTVLNLAGLGKMKSVEIVIVCVNLLVLLALAIVGMAGWWSTDRLVAASGPKPVWDAWLGAAAIFVAYEGFQLLTYEYDEIRNPKRTLTPGLVGSALVVVVIYVAVALGGTMITGAQAVVEQKTVALSVAAQTAAGPIGLVLMTVAAAFATSAAINSTLFSTAQLARRVSEDGELPAWFDHRNRQGVPDHAILLLSAVAAVLTWVGSLSALVEAASLAFLAAFIAVHVIAWRECAVRRWIVGAALVASAVIGALMVYRLASSEPVALGLILAIFVASWLGRPWLLRHVEVESAE